MPRIQAPDGSIVEFPDGMADAQIAAVMQREYGGPQQRAPIPESLKVDRPDQNWSNIGANTMEDAGIRPMTTTGQKVQGALQAIVPFNLGDEFAAAAQSAKYNFTPQQDEKYDTALTEARDAQSRFAREHPVANVALPLAGNVAATMAMGNPSGFWGQVGQGAGTGFAMGFGAGEGGFQNRAIEGIPSAAVGALTSAALYPVSKALQQPKINPDVELLKKEGVRMTPGQIAGGVAKKTEDIATSIPIAGDFIAARHSESIGDLNRAVANRALEPIGLKLPDNVPAGRDSVAFVKKAMGDAYTNVLSGMRATPDMPFATDMQGVLANAAKTLPEDKLATFQRIVDSQVWGKAAQHNSGTAGRFGKIVLDGDTIKGIESELTKEIRGYSGGGWDEQKLSGFLVDVKRAFRDLLTRQNPAQAKALATVDRAYANYVILREAGSKLGNDSGVFTPSQLLNAVRSADSSAGRGSFATGTARMQDLADAAKNVLPQKFPDSGTARRVMQGGVLSALGPAAYFSGNAVPAAAGIGLGSAAYSRSGQELARALMMGQRPASVAAIGRGLQHVTPQASMLAALLAAQSGTSAP